MIAATAKLRGDLVATGDVVIEGQLEGSVIAEGARITIGREARVRADVSGQHVVVMGTVEGTLRATERVEIRANASVVGDAFTRRFSIEDEARFRGRVTPPAAEASPVAEQTRFEAPAAVEHYSPAPEPVAQQSVPSESSLFGSPRPAGQMPAGLAAAVRNLGGASSSSDDE